MTKKGFIVLDIGLMVLWLGVMSLAYLQFNEGAWSQNLKLDLDWMKRRIEMIPDEAENLHASASRLYWNTYYKFHRKCMRPTETQNLEQRLKLWRKSAPKLAYIK